MTTIAQQVSRAIRILRGNRDESARASHLVVEKDLLMTYETDLLGQAEKEKSSLSTFFERKSMSTKTAFKRIALVAAAALAIGGISAVSAQATGASDWTISNSLLNSNTAPGAGSGSSTETATQVAGVANFVTLTNLYTGSVYFTVTGGTTTTGTTSGTVAAIGNAVSIATPTVGTITVTSYDISSGAASTTATSTTTITVQASIPGTVYASANVLANAAVGTPTTLTNTNYASVTHAADGTAVAQFSVAEVDANGVAISPAANAKAITVTSTNGLVSSPDIASVNTPNTTYISGTPVGTVSNFILSSINGLPGAATVTISVNGVVVKTYTATFTGAAVKIVATAENPVIGVGVAATLATPGVGGAAITGNTLAVKVQEFDANGNAIAVPALTVTPASTATVSATAVTATSGTFADGGTASASAVGLNLTGVAAGTTTLTVTDGTLTSAPVSIRVSSGTPSAVVYTTDAAAYPAGGAGKLTVTVSDSAGTVPAGTYVLATGLPTSSLAFAVAPANLSATVTLDDTGVSTKSFNAPLSDGSVTVNGTATTGTGAVSSTAAVFTVSSGASDAANAATDAANEATDAANAATDAANAAADSADAATQAAQDAGDKADAALAAVTALSQQVTDLLAKIAAVSAALAKISAAIAKLPKK